MLFKILSTDNLETVTVDEFVGIEKRTLSAVLLRTEGRSGKVYDFFKNLALS